MNNDNNPNSLHIDTSSGVLPGNPKSSLGVLNAQTERDSMLNQKKKDLLEIGTDLSRFEKQIQDITKSLGNLGKNIKLPDDTEKQYKSLLSYLNKIKSAGDEINLKYEEGNVSQKELIDLVTRSKKLLIDSQVALDNLSDSYDDQKKILLDITGLEDDVTRKRIRRQNIAKEETKAIEEQQKVMEKQLKNGNKRVIEAFKTDVGKLSSWFSRISSTLDINKLAQNSEMSSGQKLQTQIQQMYGMTRKQFQSFKTDSKDGLDSSVYSSEDVKQALSVLPDLNLSAKKASDLIPTLVLGQKLLGMTAEEQTKLSVLGNRNGHDMLTYTTNRIAQYMKNDNKLNQKQLNEMISMNASLATSASDYGVSSPEFTESLNNATKAITDVYGQESGRDEQYRTTMQSIMSNFESAAQAYGMSEGQMYEYLNKGGDLFDLNSNSGSGAAQQLYQMLKSNYSQVTSDWQKYSQVVGDQSIANLIRMQVESERDKNINLSEQATKNASTSKDSTALKDVEKTNKQNLTFTQKLYSRFSNWVDNTMDYVSQESFQRDVLTFLSMIEATLTASELLHDAKGIFKNVLGKDGILGKLFNSKTAGKLTGGEGLFSLLKSGVNNTNSSSGLLSKLIGNVGAKGAVGSGLLGKIAGLGFKSGASTTGGALAAGGTAIGGIGLGLGMMVHDGIKGYKDNGLKGMAREAFLGTGGKGQSTKDNVKAGVGNTLKYTAMGAGIGTLIGGPVGTAVGAGIGATAGLIASLFGANTKKDTTKLQEKQLEEQKKTAKNTALTAASMESLKNAQQLTGNSYNSSVPRKASMSSTELAKLSEDGKISNSSSSGYFSNGYQPNEMNGTKLKKTGKTVSDLFGKNSPVDGSQNIWTANGRYYYWKGSDKQYIDITDKYKGKFNKSPGTSTNFVGPMPQTSQSTSLDLNYLTKGQKQEPFGSGSTLVTPQPYTNNFTRSTNGMGSAPSSAGNPYPWRVSAGFDHYPDGSYHNGMDFGIGIGTKIGATKPGTVIKAQDDNYNSYKDGASKASLARGSGVWVKGNDGNTYIYWHMSKTAVKKGDRVDEGALLGYSGNSGFSTGPHLHLGVMTSGGKYVEPANFVSNGLFSAQGLAYSGASATAEKNKTKIAQQQASSNINDILTSTYSVKLNSSYAGGTGSTVGPNNESEKKATLNDVVNGLSEVRQTLLDLSNRQTQQEKIMNMISGQHRQDPRMS